jgi:hypothetical protein
MTKGARHPASVSCGLLHVRLASLTHREHPPPRTYRPLPCLTPQLRRQPNRRRQRLANPWRKARANPQACPVACYTFGLHPSLTASTLCLAHTSHCLALAHYSFVDGCPRRRITRKEAALCPLTGALCSQGRSWPRARKPLWEVCGRGGLVLFTLMLARLPAEPQKRQHTLRQLMGELFAYMRCLQGVRQVGPCRSPIDHLHPRRAIALLLRVCHVWSRTRFALCRSAS